MLSLVSASFSLLRGDFRTRGVDIKSVSRPREG